MRLKLSSTPPRTVPLTTLPSNLTISLLLVLRLTLSLVDDPSYVIISFSWSITDIRHSLEAQLSPPYPYPIPLTFLPPHFDPPFLSLHLPLLLLIPPSTPTTLLTPRVSLPSTFLTVWTLKKRRVFSSFSPRRVGLLMDQMSCSWRVLWPVKGILGRWARVWGRPLCRLQLKLIFAMHRYQKDAFYLSNNLLQTGMTLTRQLINSKLSLQSRSCFSPGVEDNRCLIMQQLTTKRKDRFKNTFILKKPDVPITNRKF